ncbi:hypothetical protein ACOBR2_21365 (plasmid) [Telmatobacter bradus]|uniref:hypothetical protein n=1 Tax=Telmatobacter bradus TaxID=474953 RepID=UPI003B437A92
MTKYEEMREVVMGKQRDWNEMKDRCYGYFGKFTKGLTQYIGIPDDRIKWLKKVDNEVRYLPAEEGADYTEMGAIQFCEEDGYWHLGLAITLSKPGVFPSLWYGFAIMLKEDEKDVLLKTGFENKEWRIPSNQIGSYNEAFERIATASLEVLTKGKTYRPTGIGFLS